MKKKRTKKIEYLSDKHRKLINEIFEMEKQLSYLRDIQIRVEKCGECLTMLNRDDINRYNNFRLSQKIVNGHKTHDVGVCEHCGDDEQQKLYCEKCDWTHCKDCPCGCLCGLQI